MAEGFHQAPVFAGAAPWPFDVAQNRQAGLRTWQERIADVFTAGSPFSLPILESSQGEAFGFLVPLWNDEDSRAFEAHASRLSSCAFGDDESTESTQGLPFGKPYDQTDARYVWDGRSLYSFSTSMRASANAWFLSVGGLPLYHGDSGRGFRLRFFADVPALRLIPQMVSNQSASHEVKGA